jgi:hypothetical protein
MAEEKQEGQRWVICFADGSFEARYTVGEELSPPVTFDRNKAFRWLSQENARAQARTYSERGFWCEVLPWKE